MNFAGLMSNDIVDSVEGVCVSLWFCGCVLRCHGCQNAEWWDPDSGEKVPNDEVVSRVLDALDANGISRNLSILGGEPFADYNVADCAYILSKVKEKRPGVKVYLWTGYTIEELLAKNTPDIKTVLGNVNILIDGPYKEELRDTSLLLRGSSNQRVIRLDEEDIDQYRQ